MIQCVDVQAVGQNGTKIGLAAFNVWFHQLTGVHMTIYTITDWLGLVPIFVCLCSGMLGMVQLIKRRSLLRVDSDILLLGAYYVIVIRERMSLAKTSSLIWMPLVSLSRVT